MLNIGSLHIIHSGLQSSLWHDRWMPQGSLRTLIAGPLLRHEDNMKVAEAFDNSGNWNWHMLSFSLPPNIIQTMFSLPRNPLGSREDIISWAPTIDGTYTLKFAYELLTKKNSAATPLNFKWIWKLDCTPRIKCFTWLIWHNSIPTNMLLSSRGIDILPLCVFFGSCNESPEHILRSCVVAADIWRVYPFNPVNLWHDDTFGQWFKKCATCLTPSSLKYSFGNTLSFPLLEPLAS